LALRQGSRGEPAGNSNSHGQAILDRLADVETQWARLQNAGASAAAQTLALASGYTHQAVAKAVDLLERQGLVESRANDRDLRKRLVSLTRTGRHEAKLVDDVAARAAEVFADVFAEIGVDIFSALRAFEAALDRRPLEGRLLETDGEGQSAAKAKRRKIAPVRPKRPGSA
jgi:DNA-binding MarR family transcriptional regulator